MTIKTPGSFSGPQGKTILGIVAGSAVLTYFAILNVQRDVKDREGNVAIHREPQRPGPDYISKDALEAVARPAKNSNVKGSQPTASQWV
ncbi:hypothetical protein BDN70DRAFT_880774 [Pholiota conissans]|uniref:Uncharacterized protein n=1 Tax=Pholiota conissans TaxID=109636 RepID=A0A9P6CYS0_9AGAR|nr:hypothetical protein BDN70DRAFT_880774 [Pholiota conissans]